MSALTASLVAPCTVRPASAARPQALRPARLAMSRSARSRVVVAAEPAVHLLLPIYGTLKRVGWCRDHWADICASPLRFTQSACGGTSRAADLSLTPAACLQTQEKSAVERAIQEAKETCDSGSTNECAAAWDEVCAKKSGACQCR